MGLIQPMSSSAFLSEGEQVSSEKDGIHTQIKDLLEPLDIFALLMASIGHDVGHPGVNNNFMVSKKICLMINFLTFFFLDNNGYSISYSI